MSLKTKQQINKDYYMSKKDTLIQCHECSMPIKYQSYKAHLKTDKHVANCKKQKASYLDTLKGAVAKLVDGCNIEAVSKEIFYVIQQEYFLGQAAAPKDKKDAKPVIVISQDQKQAEALYEEIMALYDKRWDVLADSAHYERHKEKYHKEVIKINTRYESIEKEFNKEQNNFRCYDIFKKDSIRYMTRVKECIITQIEKMKAKMVEIEQQEDPEQQQTVKVIDAVEDDEDTQDVGKQDEDDYGIDTYKIDDTDITTAHFPNIYEFRDLKKSRQEFVLEEIAVNCPHVFDDDRRIMTGRIYEALSERDKLLYQILYDDIFSFYQRYKAQIDSYHQSESSSDTHSANGDEEQEMFEYDFKY